MFFCERVNRMTSRDYNPIFDTDFASLVRYDRFPSLLYYWSDFFEHRPLVSRCREFVYSNIFGLYNLFDMIFSEFLFLGSFFDIKAIFFRKNQRFR